MNKITILWIIGILAFALQCLFIGRSASSDAETLKFVCGLLPLVFVPILCPLLYRHAGKIWRRHRTYTPWDPIGWSVIISGQLCLACLNFFILIWGGVCFLSVFFPFEEISLLKDFLSTVASVFAGGAYFWIIGKIVLFFLPKDPGNNSGMSVS